MPTVSTSIYRSSRVLARVIRREKAEVIQIEREKAKLSVHK